MRNLLSVIVYHELETLPFPDFEYSGNIKPVNVVKNGVHDVRVSELIFIMTLKMFIGDEHLEDMYLGSSLESGCFNNTLDLS